MSIMVEKVARALTEVQIRSANELFKLSAPRRVKTEEQIVSSIESGWRMNQKDARAAIEAMREPTKEMLEAAYDGAKIGDYMDALPDEVLSQAFTTMIDAALKTKGSTDAQ